MSTTPLLPGNRAVWYSPPWRCRRDRGRLGYRYSDIVTIVSVHPKTAHVRVRRFDGRERMRWIKLSKLQVKP